MPRKKKPFVDKKTALSFHLVPGGEDNPPLKTLNAAVTRHALLQPQHRPAEERPLADERREEQRRCGVFFNDDYDYLQHLKELVLLPTLHPDPEPDSNRLSPSPQDSTAASTLISGRHEAVDPDVTAALHDDFDFGDFDALDDDFVAKASDVVV